MIEVEEGRRVLRVEAQALLDSVERLNGNFSQASQMILACKGKVIVTGIGKSGHVARKIASTLSSTGTPSLFLHPAESSHGDLGVITEQDLILAISYSGEAEELLPIINFAVRRNISIISLTSSQTSTLGKAGVWIDISVKEEACPLSLAPTSSSTLTLALGDALAMAVMHLRGFTRDDFAQFHPNGTLGRRLLTRVKDIMHGGASLPLVGFKEDMTKVLTLMTSSHVFRGVAGVVDEQQNLAGIITDGDVRRRLEKNQNPLSGVASDMMSKNPKTIDANELAEKALFVMEQFQIQTLFVTDRSATQPKKPVGLIHLQDLLKARLR
ncbi:MAG: KpsF/GutQ family sugar-phosphate isomerase [Bdellovibrionota bacterium]